MDPHYLIDSILPAFQVSTFSGASGSGKTSLTCQLLDDWKAGKGILGHFTVPVDFGYLGADRIGADYAKKLERMNITSFKITSLLDNKNYRPSILRTEAVRLDFIRKIHEALGYPALLILDPLAPFLPAKMSDYHEVADAMVSLGRLCLELKLTVWAILHNTKFKSVGGYDRSQDRMSGSMALQAYSATKFILTDPQESHEEYHLLDINPVNDPREQYKLCRNEAGRFVEYASLGELTPSDQVLMMIPQAPERIATSELVDKAEKQLHCTRRTIERLLKRLIDSNMIENPQHGYYCKPRLPVMED